MQSFHALPTPSNLLCVVRTLPPVVALPFPISLTPTFMWVAAGRQHRCEKLRKGRHVYSRTCRTVGQAPQERHVFVVARRSPTEDACKVQRPRSPSRVRDPVTERIVSFQHLPNALACCARGRAHSSPSSLTGHTRPYFVLRFCAVCQKNGAAKGCASLFAKIENPLFAPPDKAPSHYAKAAQQSETVRFGDDRCISKGQAQVQIIHNKRGRRRGAALPQVHGPHQVGFG